MRVVLLRSFIMLRIVLLSYGQFLERIKYHYDLKGVISLSRSENIILRVSTEYLKVAQVNCQELLKNYC